MAGTGASGQKGEIFYQAGECPGMYTFLKHGAGQGRGAALCQANNVNASNTSLFFQADLHQRSFGGGIPLRNRKVSNSSTGVLLFGIETKAYGWGVLL